VPVGGIVIAGAALAATAIAAVAVAGAGVIVVREGARAVMACGQELQAMAQENLRMQRALQNAARRYDAQIREQASAQDAARNLTLRSQLAEQHRQHQQVCTALNAQLQAVQTVPEIDQAAVQALCDQLFAAEPPALAPRFDRLSGWANKVHQAIILAEQLGQKLQGFTVGPHQGLFKTDFLQELHQESLQQLRSLETQADFVDAQNPPDVSACQNALAALSYLDRRMKEMELIAPERRQQRLLALAAIERAQQALGQRLDSAPADNELIGMQVVMQTINDAARALEKLEFSTAQGIAESAQQHLQALADVAMRQRQRNLELFLQRLHQQVEPLRAIDELRAPVAAWLERYEQIARNASQQIEATWQQLTGSGGLVETAERLQQQALQALLRQGAQSLSELSQHILEEMGYQVETQQEANGSQMLIGRQGQRRFYVTLSETGSMSLRAEGFGNASCKPTLERFLSRIKEQGAIGVWQQQFSLSEAVQRLTGILQEAGLNVKIEPGENGATVLASGTVQAAATVSYDGAASFSPALNQIYQQWIEQVRSSESMTQRAPDEASERLEHLDEEWARRQQLAQEQHEAFALREYHA
jgi:hypothetical protein